MPFRSLLAGATASGLLLLAGAFALSAPAEAAPPLTITGTAPATAHGPGTVAFSYTITVPTAIDSTVFSTHQDVALPAIGSSVKLDGTAVPSAQVTQSAGDLTVQVGPNPTDGLSAGTHTITFNATLATATATASTSSTAELAWQQAATPATATSAPVLIAVNQIDLATVLTPDTDEDTVGSIGTDGESLLLVDVSNLGYGQPDSELDIDLPPGLALGPDGVTRDDDGTELTCAPAPGNAQQIVCDLGVLTHTPAGQENTLDIDLVATSAAPVGQTVPITVSAHPKTGQGTDANSTNDSATAHLKYTGSAALSYTITPAHKKLALGSSTTLTLTVHNSGPQTAGETIAFSVVIGPNFTVTGFTGNTTPPGGFPDLSTNIPPSVGSQVLWFVGDLAAHRSITATLTLKAAKIGTAKVALFAFSDATDPNCAELQCQPTLITLTAIAAPKATTPDTTPQGRQLANTGSDTGHEIGIAATLILLGSLLLTAGRRRRTQ